MIAENRPPEPEEPDERRRREGRRPLVAIESHKDIALYRRAMRNDWPVGRRMRRKIVKGLAAKLDDPKLMMDAAKTLIHADVANIRREALDVQAARQPDTTNVNVAVGVQVIEDENWYGNSAKYQAAEAQAASSAGAAGPESIQGGSLRPAVGQNGNGAANGHKGPRPDQGGDAGGH